MICQKCQKFFKVNTVIDGKPRNLCSRKFCLECSPFGLHNTRNIIKPRAVTVACTLTEKLCKRCGVVHPIDNFYKKPDGRPYPYCKPCANLQTTKRQQRLKRQIVEYLGGSCSICGYNKYVGALDLHHIDPSKKDHEISRKKTVAFETIKSEVDKCILLCANCHAEVHGNITSLVRIERTT